MALYLNCIDNDLTYNKKNYLLRAAKSLGLIVRDYTDQQNPEWVLNIEPYATVVRGTNWTGAWWIDLLMDNPKFEGEWPHLDTVFLAGTTARITPRDNYRLLFQAADLPLHRQLPQIEKSCDFTLAGTNGLAIYRERERCIQLLREKGYTFVDAGKNHIPSEYVECLNRARVQFVRSMQVGKEGEIAQRFFECLAIGPVLTNYVPDLEQTGLVEGVEYLAYNTDEEMIVKMDKLIKDEPYRLEMAEKGRQKAILYHSYENRLMTILNTIQEFERKHGR